MFRVNIQCWYATAHFSITTLWTGLFIIHVVECLASFFLLLCFIAIPVFNSNSVDPDKTPRSVVSDLGLHCLPIPLFWVSRLKWVSFKYPFSITYQNICIPATILKLKLLLLFMNMKEFWLMETCHKIINMLYFTYKWPAFFFLATYVVPQTLFSHLSFVCKQNIFNAKLKKMSHIPYLYREVLD